MKLTRHDLIQLDERYLDSLKMDPDKLLNLTKSLLHDLKKTTDRLNQNSGNSSRPPASDLPWEKTDATDSDDFADEEEETESQIQDAPVTSDSEDPEPAQKQPKQSKNRQQSSSTESKRKPGKQPGAPGFGRTWKPRVTNTEYRKASHCAVCGTPLGDDAEYQQYTAYDSVDLVLGVPELLGCQVTVTRYALFDAICPCGHITRETAHREPANSLYADVELSEWRLIGPTLASCIVHFRMRMRLSLLRIRELLLCLVGIPLSKGVLQKCIEESGASADPLEDELATSVFCESLVHIDETSWPQSAEKLWLWVFTSSLTVCYCIGGRTKAMFKNMLSKNYDGWLMSDGYHVYREYKKRLRCWAHIYRKGKGLKESTDNQARCFGTSVLAIMEKLQTAVYQWRELNEQQQATEKIRKKYTDELEDFRKLCEIFAGSEHEKTGMLAREFLKDWDAFFRVLEHPYLPLTNNEAERALRHWVIARRISYGTRSDTGSRVFALLASVIDTCRKRQVDSVRYLAEVISAARTGKPIPLLPQPILKAGGV
jgi:transposase